MGDGDGSPTPPPPDLPFKEVTRGMALSDSPEKLQSDTGMAIVLRKLSEVLRSAGFPPLAVASTPTDELLLPLPLPHALGRLLEKLIEVSIL